MCSLRDSTQNIFEQKNNIGGKKALLTLPVQLLIVDATPELVFTPNPIIAHNYIIICIDTQEDFVIHE